MRHVRVSAHPAPLLRHKQTKQRLRNERQARNLHVATRLSCAFRALPLVQIRCRLIRLRSVSAPLISNAQSTVTVKKTLKSEAKRGIAGRIVPSRCHEHNVWRIEYAAHEANPHVRVSTVPARSNWDESRNAERQTFPMDFILPLRGSAGRPKLDLLAGDRTEKSARNLFDSAPFQDLSSAEDANPLPGCFSRP